MSFENRRARHGRNYYLKRLNYNIHSQKYEFEEFGIVYSMPFELVMSLKLFFLKYSSTKEKPCPYVFMWFEKLSPLDKKLVMRSGDIPEQTFEFYPDDTYDE
jgi:hypothetical protein